MDHLSAIVSITGILAVAAKVTTALAGFIEKNRDTPESIRSVLTELDSRPCVEKLLESCINNVYLVGIAKGH